MNIDTQQLISELHGQIDKFIAMELKSTLDDMQLGMASLYSAKNQIDFLDPRIAPIDFLRLWIKAMENRQFRLLDEDAGEYGSGRDALDQVLIYAHQKLAEMTGEMVRG
ncbi:MAG: hypothetical protein GX801_01315 [Fibrobacter sp.]|nr:hypothetical protein [Fibrobacter sp.]